MRTDSAGKQYSSANRWKCKQAKCGSFCLIYIICYGAWNDLKVAGRNMQDGNKRKLQVSDLSWGKHPLGEWVSAL